MFAPPPPSANVPGDIAPSPKRRRLESEVEENRDPNACGSENSVSLSTGIASGLTSEQLARIEQNRLAAFERKQQKVVQQPLDEQSSGTRGVDSDQRARIEQNRLAALARKQERTAACQQEPLADPDTQGLDAEKRARIEQNRLAALARKQQRDAADQQGEEPVQEVTPCTQDLAAEQRSRIEQNRLAALARKQQRACTSQDVQSIGEGASESRSEEQQEREVDDSHSSSSPPTPPLSFCSAPSTPSTESSLLANESADTSDDGNSSSDSSHSDCESSSSEGSSSSSDSSTHSSSESDSSCENGPSHLTPEQHAKIAQNRRTALARKKGLTSEQLARIEENRRAALARKRGENPGLDPTQRARIEENRRRALERKQQKESAEAKSKESDAAAQVATTCATGVPLPKPVEERDIKQKLVAQLLCRWWFALPPWPPENFDSDAELAVLRYWRAPVNTFDQEPEFDKQGFRKAYELEQFKGCFRTSDGKLLDVRPKEGRPSYDQLMLNSKADLYRLLIAAFDAQLMELFAETQKKGAPKELEVHLQDLRKQAAAVRQKAIFFLSFTSKKKTQ